MTRRIVSALVAAAVILPAAFSAQVPISKPPSVQADKNPFTGNFNKYVEGVMDEWKLAGMAVAVIDGDDVFTEAYGYSNLPDTKTTPETLFCVGSTTKAQVAASLSHLIHTKDHPSLKEGWSTRISSITRDDFVLQEEWATEHITLEDAASHRTGLPTHDLSLTKYPNSSTPMKDAVRNLRNLPVQLEPRVQWNYCNPMWLVLTHVVETITGTWLRDTLKKVIWDPLNMTSTFIDMDAAKESGLDLSTGYWYDKKNGKHVAMPFIPTTEVSGAGAIISSVVDYAKWVKALLKKDGFLKEAVHEDIVKPRFVAYPEPLRGADVTMYTLGWFRTTLHGERLIWHSGSTGTHGALVYWLPERNYGVVIFENYPSAVQQVVMYRLIEDKLDIPDDKRVDINKVAKQASKEMKQDFANATNILFPNRPSPPLPPTLKPALLAGKYHHEGYGSLVLTEGPHDDKNKESILVAERPEFVWSQSVTLEHASGDYWTARWRVTYDNPEDGSFFKARFVMGSDGRVSGLEVEYRQGVDGFLDGVVFYERI